jgi:hypothetical protein
LVIVPKWVSGFEFQVSGEMPAFFPKLETRNLKRSLVFHLKPETRNLKPIPPLTRGSQLLAGEPGII